MSRIAPVDDDYWLSVPHHDGLLRQLELAGDLCRVIYSSVDEKERCLELRGVAALVVRDIRENAIILSMMLYPNGEVARARAEAAVYFDMLYNGSSPPCQRPMFVMDSSYGATVVAECSEVWEVS